MSQFIFISSGNCFSIIELEFTHQIKTTKPFRTFLRYGEYMCNLPRKYADVIIKLNFLKFSI